MATVKREDGTSLTLPSNWNDLDNTHLQFWYGLKIGGNFVGSGVSGGYVYLF